MQCRAIDPDSVTTTPVGREGHPVVTIPDFLADPARALESARQQDYAKINPHYPGIRAQVPADITRQWGAALTPVINETFGLQAPTFDGLTFFSIVTSRREDLSPIQLFPHVDGGSSELIAMMLYLHHTPHGGTGFFRHRETGYESLSKETYPGYAETLQRAVERDGLPRPAYVEDGAPYFELIHAAQGRFNEAILYHGNCLHSALINNDAPLSPDPEKGRLTINAVFWPDREGG